ncbi:wd repeat-containing protein 82 [Lentinula edodes]|uniref:Wd repeat-containing protein 82 n=1 Tax=Lentinula edodes TaxID=5353 RepID=A0A1Q3EKQ4_LENED|nr:wd repeat-containing protein 82 [Lentinula edodes]
MVMAPSTNANNGSSQPQLTLSNGTMLKLKPSRIFKTAVENPTVSPGRPSFGPRHITGICFDDRGDQLLTAAEDETFRLYNCKSGKHLKTLQSKKIYRFHKAPCVKFNPRHGMMATAGAELAFWLPDTAPESEEVARDLLKRKAPA